VLNIGDSFLGSGNSKSARAEFNTLRFDFKPASISSGSEAYIAESQNENDFQVIVPGEGQKATIFKGAKKAIKGDKECLLVYDKKTKELRLERVSANINVKKTRDTELDKKVKKDIERLRKEKGHKSKAEQNQTEPMPAKKEPSNQTVALPDKKERTVSISSAGEEVGEENYDEDENVSALEQLVAPTFEIESANHQQKAESSSSPPKKQPVQKQPSPVKKASSFVKKSILAEDLQLSESSSEDEEMDD